jgi:hypothetical protein
VNLSERYVRSGNVHLWAVTIPGSDYLTTLCGTEQRRHSTNGVRWTTRDRKRCERCAIVAGVLRANGVKLAVSQ